MDVEHIERGRIYRRSSIDFFAADLDPRFIDGDLVPIQAVRLKLVHLPVDPLSDRLRGAFNDSFDHPK